MTTKLSKQDGADAKRMTFVRELLKEFGLRLCGWSDPGGTAYFLETDHPANRSGGNGYWGEPIDFSPTVWRWLEPLLVELREHRKRGRKK